MTASRNRILVAGACGFVGSTIIKAWRERCPSDLLVGVDNLSRAGSELNRATLKQLGVRVLHADLRSASDVETFPEVDWVIDAAALPSVSGGIDGATTSRQLMEHNLTSCINLLEFCKRQRAGLVLLSTSRVYSVRLLHSLPLAVEGSAFGLAPGAALPRGVTSLGVAEDCSTQAPVSLYGASKLAAEQLALEYGESFDFPVWINRCGVMAGAGQFGRPDQGIVAFWLNSWLRDRPLTYFGFGCEGHQVRDCLHPQDLVPLIERQLQDGGRGAPRTVNVSGGLASAFSLRQLSEWCESRWGARTVRAEPATHLFDLPWVVLDAALAESTWDWKPAVGLAPILDDIACHAEAHPHWLDLSSFH